MSLERSAWGSISVKGTLCRRRRSAIVARNELFPDPEIPMICLWRSKSMPVRVTSLLPSTVWPNGKVCCGLCCNARTFLLLLWHIFCSPPGSMKYFINQVDVLTHEGIPVLQVNRKAGYKEHCNSDTYQCDCAKCHEFGDKPCS